jgi:hypothetical protein
MYIAKINKYIIAAIAALAFIISASYVVSNLLYLFAVIGNGIVAIFIWKKIRYPLMLVSLYLIISCLFVSYLNNVNQPNLIYNLNTPLEKFIPNFLIAIAILAIPFYLIYNFYVKKVGLAIDEERQNYTTKSHPYLICKEHYTRTHTTVIGVDYIRVKCRAGNNCAKEKKLTYAKQLIGIVGKPVTRSYYKGNYYVAMWDPENKLVVNGDYDIIEIHENPGINDFDAIVNKIIAMFYNDVDRYIPIYQVVLKIVGNPEFTTSTQRLIDKSFTNIKYL